MNFEEANEAMKQGEKVRLPEWRGYWFKESERKFKALTKDGNIEDAWPPENYGRLDWEIAEGLDFGWALTALQAGKLVCREGWNGAGMFVFIRPSDEIFSDVVVNNVKSLPQALKDYYRNTIESPDTPLIKFTSYFCMKNAQGEIINGWIPTTTDLLAKDWRLYNSSDQ